MNETNQEPSDALVIYSDPIFGVKDILSKETQVNVLLESLFCTKEGKQFARQIDEQKKFTTFGIVFQIVQQFMVRALPRLLNAIADDDELKTWTAKKIDGIQDIDEAVKDQLRFIPTIMGSLQQDDNTKDSIETNVDTWGAKASERFLGGMVFALHSYLQAYIDSTIDSILQFKPARAEFLRKLDKKRVNPKIGLTELDQLERDKDTMLSELVKRSLPLNLIGRMKVICELLGCLGDLNDIIEKYSLNQAMEEMKFLCDMRNQIAHGNPAPELEDYGLQFEPYDWAGVKEKLNDEIAKQWNDAPTAIFALIEIGCDAAEKSSPMKYISLLNRLPRMAVLHAALFDFVINRRIKQLT